MKKFKHCFIIFMIMVLTINSSIVFTGCKKVKEVVKKESIDSVEDMFKANKEAFKKVKNYNADLKGDLKIIMGSEEEGGSMNMPISASAKMAIGEDTAHGTLNMEMYLFGQEEKTKGEFYLDLKDKKAYGKFEEDENWSVSSLEDVNIDFDKVTDIELPDSIIKASELKEEKDNYIITCNLTKIDFKDLLESIDLSDQDIESVDLDSFKIEEGKIIYTFDSKTNLLKEIKFDNFTIVGTQNLGVEDSSDSSSKMDYSISLNGDIKLSNYNKLDKQEYEIPKEVKEKANKGDDSIDDFNDNIEDAEEDISYED